MKKNEIKQILIDKHGLKESDLKGVKVKGLKFLLETKEANADKKQQTVEAKATTPQKKKIKKLDSNSPEWTQYVLSHFEDDELEGKHPKVDGLRRVTELLLGTIAEEGCDLVYPPSDRNEMRACVKAWIVIKTKDGIKRFEALADTYAGNCNEEFGVYLTALADTRAKGRCFRNALRLKQVIAAEESDKTSLTSMFVPNNGKIDQGQIRAIDMMCVRNSLDLKETLDSIDISYDLDSGGNISLSELSNQDGRKILQEMNKISIEKNQKE